MREITNYVPKKSGTIAITDKQFDSNHLRGASSRVLAPWPLLTDKYFYGIIILTD